MRLEDQVCSLELAKKLKELGVRQESAFRWYLNGDWCFGLWHEDGLESYAAFSVAELGEMLPKSIIHQNKEWFLRVTCDLNAFNYWRSYGYESEEGLLDDNIEADTEADARAEMLAYLIEHGIVKPEERG